uniref:Fibronectin type-III domain-containing protein n=1 Tax=Plectus sambesii TaxID=2011161 RepID=A0A914W5W0_9BILA
MEPNSAIKRPVLGGALHRLDSILDSTPAGRRPPTPINLSASASCAHRTTSMALPAGARPAKVPHDDNDNDVGGGSSVSDDDQPLTPIKVLQLALPHLFLLVISIGYVYLGAQTFMRLEEPHWRQQRARELQSLQRQKENFVGKLYELGRSGRELDGVEGTEEFTKYASEVYKIHQVGLVTRDDLRAQFGANSTAVEDAACWTFGISIFFVISTLTTIGYGNVTPTSPAGRAFCICFAVIGVPLLLITTADFAKFLATAITAVYIEYLQLKEKLKEKVRQWWQSRILGISPPPVPETGPTEDPEEMADFLWSHMENVHVVKLSATLVLSIVLGYSLLGGILLPLAEEWTFFDAFYYSFISCMKIGFGDMVPQTSAGLWVSLTYSLCGLTISTMCIDTVGGWYLERLHNYGRVMGTTDYLHFMKAAKFKRKKKEVMQQHYSTLVMLGQINLASYQKKTSCAAVSTTSSSKNKAEELKLPSSPPGDFRVVNITPYSIKLAWIPPDAPGKNAKYVINYKIKHHKTQTTLTIDDVSQNEVEIKGLKSFSIYEIEIYCTNKCGRSGSVKIVQITEPESAPQEVTAVSTGNGAIRVEWQAPCKMGRDITAYAIYYSDEPKAPFESWFKVQTQDAINRQQYLTLLKPNTKYAICVCAVYLKGAHSPLSKSVICATEEQEINANESDVDRYLQRLSNATAVVADEDRPISFVAIPEAENPLVITSL